MYISQMHFGEGFAAGPDVDRRQLVASSALRPRCNFFLSPSEPLLRSESPPLFARSCPHIFFFLLFTISSSTDAFVLLSPRCSLAFILLLHTFARQNARIKHGRTQGKWKTTHPTHFHNDKNRDNYSFGGHDRRVWRRRGNRKGKAVASRDAGMCALNWA